MQTITDQTEFDLDLNHFLDILLRRRWIAIGTLCLTLLATAGIVYTTIPLYKGEALIVIEKERGGGVYNEGKVIENTQDDYYQTQYKLIKSYSLLEKVYNSLGLDRTAEFKRPGGVDALADSIRVVPIRRSRLVTIEAVSHDAELATKIANKTAQTFLQENLKNQLFISQEILKTLQSDPEQSSIADYESLPAVVNNPLIQSLKIDYAKLNAELANLKPRYTEKHPTIVSMRANLDSLQRQIKSETLKIVQSLKTELSGQLKGNNVRIVDLARVPTAPFKPRQFRSFLIGTILGSILGFLMALLIEVLDQSIRSQDDVAEKLHLPYLGLVPYAPLKGNEQPFAPLLSKEPSLTSEAFRNMRTMIDLAGVSTGSNAFLITSSLKSEGKTHVASNLAVAFAQLGEKVLLIDGDMRRPRLHKNFHISTKDGLSTFLAKGSDPSELSGLLQSTKIPNLNVLSCGARPPNPSELLNTPRLGAMIAWAKSNFDRVIVDCTPMFPIHDTLLWARHIPSGVFVVRYGTTRTPLIRSACRNLQTGGVNLLGIVINAARPGGLTYAAYGYYYQQYYHDYTESHTAQTIG